ncbi:uncharacterized protein N7500_004240 [Penicillium coprophilum]|uniref:uncharacterized protein n=1 Tax=Penicillium coprophilum TaxID=36646 RepID=UPI002398D7E1|nr:uncharacterized protein N7500_004240 [Penicillium coprophilum]KAJ5171457.1 hypothetical protein N7500_004240 [Penicillium coprophilum]
MSPDHQQTGLGTMRRHLSSLSSIFRSQTSKRASSMIVAVQEQPTCHERIHYPVFNPLDPRHNPEIQTLSWGLQEQRSLSSESRSPMAWVQSLSRRSLHRARSGLYALRLGFIHRSSEEENPEKGYVSPAALRRERQQHRGVSSGAYTSDTQEDLAFGAELSRMNPTPSSSSANANVRSLIRVSPIPSVHDSPATLPTTLLASESACKLPEISGRAVSNSGVNSTSANHHGLDFQFEGARDLGASMNSENHFTHATLSTENHLIDHTWGVAISTEEDIKISSDRLSDAQTSCGEHQTGNLQRQNISHVSSDTQTSDNPPSSIPISRQCSAEVRFAFPGIYRETLDQWARHHGNPNHSQDSSDPERYSPNLSQHSLGLSQQNSSPSQHGSSPSHQSLVLYEQEGTLCASQGPLECIMHQDDTYSNMPPPYDEYDEGRILLVPPQTPTTHSEETQSFCYPNPLSCISNRNFGRRWSSISERATTQWSSVEDYSSRYTPDNTTSRDITSTEMTSMESMSNDTWSPIDSEVLFPSPVEDGNGYSLFDGKTNSQYPDRGNESVKSAQHATSNCGNTRGSQNLTEVISPGILSLRLMPNGIPDVELEFVEEDTDDEFYPGIVQPRQAW